MMEKAYSAATVAAALLLAWQATAGDLGFETSAEAIVTRLLVPKATPKLKFRGIGKPKSIKSIKVRGLIIAPDNGQMVEVETTVATENKRIDGIVNLNVLFDIDSFAIRGESFPLLDELGKALRHPQLVNRTVSINGHTDAEGSEAYNLRLSLKRAIRVRQYLTSNHGIRLDRVRVMGFGEGVPLRPNTSVAGKRLNRRVEIVAVN
jgi:outer membrane protein OmpA-like peptidoglycan-associated protein